LLECFTKNNKNVEKSTHFFFGIVLFGFKAVHIQGFNKVKRLAIFYMGLYQNLISGNCFKTFKILFMGNLLYLIAVILVIAWAIGFLGYHAGGLIHILLVIAVVAVLLKVIRGSAE